MLPDAYSIVKDQVGPCGIRCVNCALGNGSVAESAIELKRYIARYELPSWAYALPGGAEIDFKRLDGDLLWVERSVGCPGCLRGGGNPECPIRLCSKEKGHSSCGQCADLESCQKFSYLGEKGKMLKAEFTGHP